MIRILSEDEEETSSGQPTFQAFMDEDLEYMFHELLQISGSGKGERKESHSSTSSATTNYTNTGNLKYAHHQFFFIDCATLELQGTTTENQLPKENRFLSQT